MSTDQPSIKALTELNPNTFKAITCFLILILGLSGGFMPKFVYKKGDPSNNNNEPSLKASLLNMFTAGIFLSSALLHFLPDAFDNEQMKQFLSEKTGLREDYPFASLLMMAGFLLLLSIEAVVHELNSIGGLVGCFRCRGPSSPRKELATNDHFHSHDHCHSQAKYAKDIGLTDSCCLQKQSCRQDSPTIMSYGSVNDKEEALLDSISSSAENQMDEEDLSYGGSVDGDVEEMRLMEDQILEENDNQHEDEAFNTSSIMALIVFLSLAVHSFMEGLGVGSQGGCAWDIFFAILAHKSLVAFSMGVDMMNRNLSNCSYAMYIISFSVLTPIGIIFGWVLITAFAGEDSALSGICTAISGGTFLFVSTMEIIPTELKNHKHTGLKLLTLISGFSLIAITSQYV